MDEKPNPFEAPITESTTDSIEYLTGYQPQGLPHPNVLGWIGVVLAASLVAAIVWGNWSYLPMFLIFPSRILWVIYARVQMRKHEDTWSPGSRTFVMAIWAINLLILSLEGMLILLFATCLIAFG